MAACLLRIDTVKRKRTFSVGAVGPGPAKPITNGLQQQQQHQQQRKQPIPAPAPKIFSEVLFPYADEQTTVQLKRGDKVEVVQAADALGNAEWSVVRAGNGDEFFYPSNYLQRIC